MTAIDILSGITPEHCKSIDRKKECQDGSFVGILVKAETSLVVKFTKDFEPIRVRQIVEFNDPVLRSIDVTPYNSIFVVGSTITKISREIHGIVIKLDNDLNIILSYHSDLPFDNEFVMVGVLVDDLKILCAGPASFNRHNDHSYYALLDIGNLELIKQYHLATPWYS